MKASSLKLLMLFFISAGVFSCSDDSPLTEKSDIDNLNVENSTEAGSFSGRVAPQMELFSSTVFTYFNTYKIGGGLETVATAPHGHVIIGIGASVSASRNVDRIVIATRAVNVLDGTLGTIEYHGFGAVGSNDNNPNNCEAWIQVPQQGQVITEVGVASQGTNMAHIWVRYRDYDPATRRLGSTLYLPTESTPQPGVTTQRSFTVPSSEPTDRAAITSIGLGCSGSTGRIDGFQVSYGVLE